MAQEETPKVLERVAEVAARAGLAGHMEEDRYFLGVSLEGARKQGVYVRDVTSDPGRPTISVFSPCLKFEGGISRDLALELLRANETMPFARFGLYETGQESLVVASLDHLLETLDPEELRAGVFSVAMAADRFEEKFGWDDY